MSIIASLFVSAVVGAEYSSRLDEKARKKLTRAYEKQFEAEEIIKRKEEETDNSMIKLANRKRAILSTSINDFIEVYSKIKKINFVETDGIKELDKKLQLPENVGHMNQMISVNKAAVKWSDEDVVKAFLISGVIGAAFAKDSKKNLKIANAQMKVANVAYSQAQTIKVTLDGIIQMCDNFSELLSNMNFLFVKSIRNSNRIIEGKGYDKSLYSEEDRKVLMTCMNIAVVVKELIDVPILDEEGEIAQKAVESLQTGNKYFQEIREIL